MNDKIRKLLNEQFFDKTASKRKNIEQNENVEYDNQFSITFAIGEGVPYKGEISADSILRGISKMKYICERSKCISAYNLHIRVLTIVGNAFVGKARDFSMDELKKFYECITSDEKSYRYTIRIFIDVDFDGVVKFVDFSIWWTSVYLIAGRLNSLYAQDPFSASSFSHLQVPSWNKKSMMWGAGGLAVSSGPMNPCYEGKRKSFIFSLEDNYRNIFPDGEKFNTCAEWNDVEKITNMLGKHSDSDNPYLVESPLVNTNIIWGVSYLGERVMLGDFSYDQQKLFNWVSGQCYTFELASQKKGSVIRVSEIVEKYKDCAKWFDRKFNTPFEVSICPFKGRENKENVVVICDVPTPDNFIIHYSNVLCVIENMSSYDFDEWYDRHKNDKDGIFYIHSLKGSWNKKEYTDVATSKSFTCHMHDDVAKQMFMELDVESKLCGDDQHIEMNVEDIEMPNKYGYTPKTKRIFTKGGIQDET